ncbi:MAG: GNAT family N-acetyltransferase [Chloroflexi bacterium]|nr:GNAT family N-acetyltransferase [Chloroflexota bacterium]
MPPREFVVRPFRATDRDPVAALLSRLSRESLFERFHSAGIRVDSAMLDCVTAGYALIAELDGQVVGLASYNGARCELGIVVDDKCRRCGIGNALCRELLRGAERDGVSKVMASIMHSNHAMLRLLQSLEWPLLHVNDGSSLEVTIQLQSL